MIDFHCHLLPSLDDGPDSVEASLAMARALAAFGFREVHCTPHCIAGQYEISPVEVREAVNRLRARLALEGIALTLHAGMEYYLDDCFERFAANLLPLGESRLVLCEAPPQAPPELVSEMASLIVVQGFIPLLAHPERSEPVWQLLEEEERFKEQGSRSKVQGARFKGQGTEGGEQEGEDEAQGTKTVSWWRRLITRSAARSAEDSALSPQHSALSTQPSVLSTQSSTLPEGVLYQANLGSFTGFYGPQPQRRAYELLQRGVYSCFASDLHEARSATALLEHAKEKIDFNPALQKLATFVVPRGQGGNDQLAFW